MALILKLCDFFHLFHDKIGKKGKKKGEKKLSLHDFLATNAPPGQTTSVAKYVWADECEEDDDPVRQIINLPTAPRSARMFDDDAIPQEGPFSAHVTNLPFDLNEEDIEEFFAEYNVIVKELRLPRDDKDPDRLRGFGHVEFETRDDLIDAIQIPDPLIRGRRIRIDLSSDNDKRGGYNNRGGGYNNYNRGGSDDNTNWRERKDNGFDSGDKGGERRGGGGGAGGYGNNRSYNNREERDRTGDDTDWRGGDRPVAESPPPERRRQAFGDRGRDGDRGGERRPYARRERTPEEPQERPKIFIKPRTLPLPELNFPKEDEIDGRKKTSLNGDHNDSGVVDEGDKEAAPAKPKPSAADIFGQAKPVDTAARERIIEERLEQERLDKIKMAEEKRQKDKEDREAKEEADRLAELEEKTVEPEIIPTFKPDIVIHLKDHKDDKKDEEVNSWRKRDEGNENGSESEGKSEGGSRRQFSPPRRTMNHRRDDDRERPRQFNKDNNNRDGRGYR